MDLDTFIEPGVSNQQDALIETAEVLLHEIPLAAVEHSDAVETAIIPMPDVLDDLVETTPIQSIPTSLASLFCNLEEDWVRESILKGAETIIDIISNHNSARDLLASRA